MLAIAHPTSAAMSRRQLTAKQLTFLRYLRDYIAENEIWPTYREIVDHFGFRSPNSVTQNLQALYRKGHLRKDSLGFQLVDQPSRPSEGGSSIPVRGYITAGALQEAVDADMGSITLETLFPRLDRIFAIRVSGRSMAGAGIEDGDYVLLVDDDIPDGGIGAVLYNGETSLKRIYRRKDGLRLEPANEAYKAILIQPELFEEVRVLGRYVGHVNDKGIFKRGSAA